MRHFLSLSDVGASGLVKLLDRADAFKKARSAGGAEKPLSGKSIALMFDKASTRTRLSLEVAVAELGGHPVTLSTLTSQLGRGEPIADTARVLSRMVHAITWRTTAHHRLEELARHSAVPVLNALTDHSHPMQLLADLQTIRSAFGQLDGLKFSWIGDGNNMANSWLEAAGLLRLNLVLACPEGYEPDAEEIQRARERGAAVELVREPRAAVSDADVVSTDVFTSMGQEAEASKRAMDLASYRVSTRLMECAKQTAIVLHCLPAHRGEEIDAAVIDGPNSRVWEQAEARLHTAKAVLCWALEADG